VRLCLTLVRHGRAESQGRGQFDFDRALDRRGLAEVNEMARRCHNLGLLPDLLLASAALRTRQTAEAFQRTLERAPQQLQVERALYLAEAGLLLEWIRNTADSIAHLMIVGHNPGLNDLAAQLAPAAGFAGFDTGATCSMEFVATTWRGVRPGAAETVRYDTPDRFFDPRS
jgi:phosphohistidine phosphatase